MTEVLGARKRLRSQFAPPEDKGSSEDGGSSEDEDDESPSAEGLPRKRVHHKEGQVKCTFGQCGKMTHPNNLQRHLRTHSYEQPPSRIKTPLKKHTCTVMPSPQPRTPPPGATTGRGLTGMDGVLWAGLRD